MRQTRVAWRKPRPSPHIRVKELGLALLRSPSSRQAHLTFFRPRERVPTPNRAPRMRSPVGVESEKQKMKTGPPSPEIGPA
jgi:hypothetical protein